MFLIGREEFLQSVGDEDKVGSELIELQLSVACICPSDLVLRLRGLLFTEVRDECVALQFPSSRDKFLEVREGKPSPSIEENNRLRRTWGGRPASPESPITNGRSRGDRRSEQGRRTRTSNFVEPLGGGSGPNSKNSRSTVANREELPSSSPMEGIVETGDFLIKWDISLTIRTL